MVRAANIPTELIRVATTAAEVTRVRRTEQALDCTGSPRPHDLVRWPLSTALVTEEPPRHREVKQLAWKVLRPALKLQFLTPKPTSPHRAPSKCLIITVGAAFGKATESPVQLSSLQLVAQGLPIRIPPFP